MSTNDDDDPPSDDDAPSEFYCAITHAIMEYPVIDSEGHSYEKKAIERWLREESATSPLTRRPMSIESISFHEELHKQIARWRAARASRQLVTAPPLYRQRQPSAPSAPPAQPERRTPVQPSAPPAPRSATRHVTSPT
jgi:hypothetical protein